jgi:hypothetical protein
MRSKTKNLARGFLVATLLVSTSALGSTLVLRATNDSVEVPQGTAGPHTPSLPSSRD